MAEDGDILTMTIGIVTSYVAHNTVRADDVPRLIATTHAAIASLSTASVSGTSDPEAEPVEEYQAAVSVRKSLASPEHIVSMIDGKPYKTLKRHISRHGMTPSDYRERYGLKADYPMTAPAYSERRREVAKTLGLGRKRQGEAAPADDTQPEPVASAPAGKSEDVVQAPKRRGRPPKAAVETTPPAGGAKPKAK